MRNKYGQNRRLQCVKMKKGEWEINGELVPWSGVYRSHT
jgi:hypothetical protein